MLRKKLFGSSFIDEVALFEEAEKYRNVELTDTVLKKITKDQGINQATALLYKHLSDKHADFIRAIDSYPSKAVPSQMPVKLIIVPGMFYKEYPEMGGDGLFIKTIAEKFNFEYELVELKSRGSVLQNKNLLKEKLRNEKHGNIWIISFSKGSTETRLCLEELSTEKFPASIKGWVSISGLIRGTFLADDKLRSPLAKALWRTTAQIIGVNHIITKEMSSRESVLRRKIFVPPNLEIIHIAGLPLASHLQPMLIQRYEKLSQFGPNDGIITLSDFLEVPGHVYPLWGADHFFRLHSISALIYRICNYINNK